MIYAEMRNGKIKRYRNAQKALRAVLNGQVKQLWAKGWIEIGPRDDTHPSSWIWATFSSGNGAKRKVFSGHVDLYHSSYMLDVLQDAGEKK